MTTITYRWTVLTKKNKETQVTNDQGLHVQKNINLCYFVIIVCGETVQCDVPASRCGYRISLRGRGQSINRYLLKQGAFARKHAMFYPPLLGLRVPATWDGKRGLGLGHQGPIPL